MEESFSIKFIKVILNLTIFLCGFILLTVIFGSILFIKEISYIDSAIYILTYSVFFIIVYNLIKIVYSINSNPFTLENVKCFKIIGCLIIFLSFIDAIVNFKKPSDFLLWGSENISSLVLGFMALVLAEIFKKAVKIKDENDLTI